MSLRSLVVPSTQGRLKPKHPLPPPPPPPPRLVFGAIAVFFPAVHPYVQDGTGVASAMETIAALAVDEQVTGWCHSG